MERKIGEIFEYNGEWYQVVEASYDEQSCHGCFGCRIMGGECNGNTRNDGKFVVFKKLEKVGEHYMVHDYIRNKDIVVQHYKLHNKHACYNGHEEMLSFGLYGRVGMVTIKFKEPIKSLNCENSVAIEIKQNQEDMEEKELNLKEFDLEAAKAGKAVCTRDGRPARIVCFDRINDKFPIVALVLNSDKEVIYYYNNEGKDSDNDDEKDYDLVMKPKIKKGWINIHKRSGLYETEEDAKENQLNDDFVAVKVEFEI